MDRGQEGPDAAPAAEADAPVPPPPSPPLLARLRRDGLLTEDLRFIDVGCSGGVDPRLRVFEPGLAGVGFDPLVSEIERLRGAESNPKIAYLDAWLGGRTGLSEPGDPGEWRLRTSGQLAFNILNGGEDYDAFVRAQFNRGEQLVYSERRIALADYLYVEHRETPDLVKIDTDGQDLAVLRGADDAFRADPPLFLVVEANVNGLNLFSEVDRLVRGWGLALLDIEPWRYTRTALPGRFVYDLAAQTDTGPTAWCDLRYVDDPLAVFGRLDLWLQDGRLQRCLKLAALYELFGFRDCAAELLLALRHHPLTRGQVDWDGLLDLLVPPNPFGASTYAAYMQAFRADPSRFFPSRWPR